MRNAGPAPIALFVFDRPDHTRRTLATLAEATLADRSPLYVFADGPKPDASEERRERIRQVRALISELRWGAPLELIPSDTNLGCAGSLMRGVSEVLSRHGRAVVLEDDILLSRGALLYLNQGLDLYADAPRVHQISAFIPPVATRLPPTSFARTTYPWGWATWDRAWEGFSLDAAAYLAQIRARGLAGALSLGGRAPFLKILRRAAAGEIDGWCAQWRAHMLLHDRLSLFPCRSMARNIGFDGSGRHCANQDLFGIQELMEAVEVDRLPVEEDPQTLEAIGRWYGVHRRRWRMKAAWHLLREDPRQAAVRLRAAVRERIDDLRDGARA